MRGPAEHIGSGGDQAKGEFTFGWCGARLTWDTGAGARRECLQQMQAARVNLRVAQRERTTGVRPVCKAVGQVPRSRDGSVQPTRQGDRIAMKEGAGGLKGHHRVGGLVKRGRHKFHFHGSGRGAAGRDKRHGTGDMGPR